MLQSHAKQEEPAKEIKKKCLVMEEAVLTAVKRQLCVIGSRFTHLNRTDSNASFLWLSNILLYTCKTSLSIHLSMNI